MILVDSSVLIDLIEDHPRWRAWSEDALVRASNTDDLAINVLVYAEISRSFASATAARLPGVALARPHAHRGRMFNLGKQLWHSDSSFKATPAKYFPMMISQSRKGFVVKNSIVPV